ncbi:hypothetical protein CAEBREN_17601 [Caenorhabditis brenneri]|uniref:Uncharacterized protein n=1 Tax=Caenorhabditis brenneri TaxID=135651 RepID=G0MRN6_CAEBE|nr:hypothetical protein CAEBREN_17601 [Caenorhabditis brenneri]
MRNFPAANSFQSMNVLLIFGVVLLSAHHSSANFIANCSATPEEIEHIVYYRGNYIRHHFAQIYNVSNMRELEWDQNLEKEAFKMNSCDDLKHGDNYRVEYGTAKESISIVTEFIDKTSKEWQSGWFPTEGNHPLQSKILRCHLTDKCIVPSYNYTTGEFESFYNISSIYLYGPINSLKVSDFQYGPTGSNCPEGLVEQWDLCHDPKNVPLCPMGPVC